MATYEEKRRGAEAARFFRQEQYNGFAGASAGLASPPRDVSPGETRHTDELDEGEERTQVTRSLFASGRAQDPADMPYEREPSQNGGGERERDELKLYLNDTPLQRIKQKEKEVDSLLEAENFDAVLSLRQQCLGLARIHARLFNRATESPLLLPQQHYKLARTYADREYIKQAMQHCKRAIDCMPDHIPQGPEELNRLRKATHMLLGELLLQLTPPKPQQALRHFEDANALGKNNDDTSVQAMMSHAHGLLGEQKLAEAVATAQAKSALEQRIASLDSKNASLDPEAMDSIEIRRQIQACKQELSDESHYLHKLCEEAEKEIEDAIGTLINIITAEREKGTDPLDPIMITLKRRTAELALKGTDVWALENNAEQQMSYVRDIVSTQEELLMAWENAEAAKESGEREAEVPRREDVVIPARLMVKALKTKAGILMAQQSYDEALRIYDEVLELQRTRFKPGTIKMEVHEAEVAKLKGNVHLARKEFNRARNLYNDALKLYSTHLGADCEEALELVHRINEMTAYTERM